jgi:hypothetical protein
MTDAPRFLTGRASAGLSETAAGEKFLLGPEPVIHVPAVLRASFMRLEQPLSDGVCAGQAA